MNEMNENNLPLFPNCAEGLPRVKEMLLLTEETVAFATLSHFLLSDFLLSDLLNWLSVAGFPTHDLWKKLWRAFLGFNLLIGPFSFCD